MNPTEVSEVKHESSVSLCASANQLPSDSLQADTSSHEELLNGLVEDIQEATVIACFGDFRELRVGEDGTRTPLGYSITVKESGGRTLAITLYQGVTEVWRTPLTTRVILVLGTVSLCTRGSPTCRVEGGGKRTRKLQGAGAPVSCTSRQRDLSREM
jgi:hypothetical protein